MSCFKIIRVIASVFLGIILYTTIVVGLPLVGLSRIATDPEKVKALLNESGIYRNAVEIVVETIDEESDENSFDMIIIEGDDSDLSEILSNVFTEKWLQENVEKAIDGTYAWLKGETYLPEFQIDVTTPKTQFVSSISDKIQDRVNLLPVCTEEEMESFTSGEEYNILNAVCLHPDYNISELDVLDEKILESFEEQEFFKKDAIYSEDFVDSNDDINQNVRSFYKLAQNIHLYVIGVILVLTFILFLLVPGMSYKFIWIGMVWVLSGVSLVFSNYYTKVGFEKIKEFVLNKLSQDVMEIESIALDNSLKSGALFIWKEISQYSLIILVIGIILLIGGVILKFSKKRFFQEDDTEEEKEKGIGVTDQKTASQGRAKSEVVPARGGK